MMIPLRSEPVNLLIRSPWRKTCTSGHAGFRPFLLFNIFYKMRPFSGNALRKTCVFGESNDQLMRLHILSYILMGRKNMMAKNFTSKYFSLVIQTKQLFSSPVNLNWHYRNLAQSIVVRLHHQSPTLAP